MSRFTISIVRGYDVLVNEQKTRSFLCLRLRGGRHVVQQLIAGKVDPLMRRFKRPLYYQVMALEVVYPTPILTWTPHGT